MRQWVIEHVPGRGLPSGVMLEELLSGLELHAEWVQT